MFLSRLARATAKRYDPAVNRGSATKGMLVPFVRRWCAVVAIRQAAETILWSGLARIISCVTMMWLVRCMGPQNLGISALVNATSCMVLPFINLGLDVVGVRQLALDKGNAKLIIERLNGFRLMMCLVVSVFWLAAVLIVGTADGAVFAWLFGIPATVSVGLSTTWAFQGIEKLREQGVVVMVGTVATALFALVFIRAGAGAGSDIAATVFGSFVGLVLAWSLLRKHTGARFFALYDSQRIKKMLYDARWAVAVGGIMTVYSQLDVLLVGYLATIEETGLYRAAFSLTSPLTIIMICMTVLYPRMAVWYKQNPALLWHRQRWLALAFLATASGLFAILFPLRHTLVSLVLGKQFDLSVAPFGILLAAKLLSLVTGIFSLGLLAVGREDVFCYCLIGAVTTLVIANYLLIPTFGAVAAAGVSLIAECLLLCATAFFGWRESRTSVV